MKGEFLNKTLEFKRTKTLSGSTCYQANGRYAGEDAKIRILKGEGVYKLMICEAGNSKYEAWITEDRLQAAMDAAARDFGVRGQ